jgi:DNA polymerase-3 subunit epsilon
MTKFVILDTETTGLCPYPSQNGKFGSGDHRIVEIGAIIMENWLFSENDKDQGIFHHYINPERIIGEEVIKIHGITNEKVKNAPKFQDIAKKFLEFIKDSTLVIHNAKFDLKFLNFQLELVGLPKISNNVIDTLIVAKEKFPGSPASLDALCKRFDVSLKDRSFHGALLDSKLLACVFRKMMTLQFSESLFGNEKNEMQKNFINSQEKNHSIKNQNKILFFLGKPHKILKPSKSELQANQEFIQGILGCIS